MRAAVASLAIDGVRHIWDAANRGGLPVCGSDVWMIDDGGASAIACWQCMEVIYDEVRFRQRRARAERRQPGNQEPERRQGR